MDSFGAYLKAHREKKGIRLEEIASITKIHPHALELLETNRWDQLPPEPFIRGFIVAYAKYVGLPTSEVMEKYRESSGRAKTPDTTAPENNPGPIQQPAGRPSVVSTPQDLITQVRLPSGAKMITALSLVAVVGLAALLINVGRDADKPAAETPTQITMTPETPPAGTAVATAPAAPSKDKEDDRKVSAAADPNAKPPVLAPIAADQGAAAAVAGAPAHEVTVEGKERTWMKVVIDDAAPQEVFLGEGKSATYKAMNKIKVVLGNSTGSKVTYNGKEVEGKQFMGTIRSYKFPSNARFPQDVPSQRSTSNTPAEGTPTTVTE